MNREYKWTIKILYTKFLNIFVGVATSDFDANSAMYTNGWYFNCSNSELYSGPPHNYPLKEKDKKDKKNKTEKKEKKEKKDKNDGRKSYNNNINYEVALIMDLNKKTLKFLVNNIDINKIYNDIPLDKPLFPAVLLYHTNDSVEILNF